MEGNQQKMREAFDEIIEKIDAWRTDGTMEHWQYSQLFDIADYALSAPARQCDVDTPEEQAERFRNFCKMDYISEDCPDDCPLYRKDCSTIRCPFAWAQTPYEAQEGENNG